MIEIKVIHSTGAYKLEEELNNLLNKYSDIDVQGCIHYRDWGEYTVICKCYKKEQL